jgi:hypothetical protein
VVTTVAQLVDADRAQPRQPVVGAEPLDDALDDTAVTVQPTAASKAVGVQAMLVR